MNTGSTLHLSAARQWLARECHHASVRAALERGLEFAEAIDRAGLPAAFTSGDELYEFLSDVEATNARNRAFTPPTM